MNSLSKCVPSKRKKEGVAKTLNAVYVTCYPNIEGAPWFVGEDIYPVVTGLCLFYHS